MEPPVLLSSSPVLTRKLIPRSPTVFGVATRTIPCLVRKSGLVRRDLNTSRRLLTLMLPVLLLLRGMRLLSTAASLVVSTLVTLATEVMGYTFV